jgi:hypothetical protein
MICNLSPEFDGWFRKVSSSGASRKLHNAWDRGEISEKILSTKSCGDFWGVVKNFVSRETPEVLTGFKAGDQRRIVDLVLERNLHISTACIIPQLLVAVSADSGHGSRKRQVIGTIGLSADRHHGRRQSRHYFSLTNVLLSLGIKNPAWP